MSTWQPRIKYKKAEHGRKKAKYSLDNVDFHSNKARYKPYQKLKLVKYKKVAKNQINHNISKVNFYPILSMIIHFLDCKNVVMVPQ